QTNISTKLYPNPTNGKASLEVEGLNAEAYVLIYDMVGRVIQRHKINKGKNELEIDLSGYAKGVYTIRIKNDTIRISRKLVVN
ncbi:MAG: T9SS type A sorting domain-containing protein, partial [Bacteroidales bacterium]